VNLNLINNFHYDIRETCWAPRFTNFLSIHFHVNGTGKSSPKARTVLSIIPSQCSAPSCLQHKSARKNTQAKAFELISQLQRHVDRSFFVTTGSCLISSMSCASLLLGGTGYGLDDRDSISGKARNVSILHSAKTGSGAHPTSYLVGTAG
jgi:hypothetical protein